jgi:hypothetical protein
MQITLTIGISPTYNHIVFNQKSMKSEGDFFYMKRDESPQ